MAQEEIGWHTLIFASPIPAHLADEFRRRIFFIDQAIDDFECIGADGRIDQLRLRSALTPVGIEAVFDKIQRVVTKEILSLRLPEQRLAWQHSIDRARALSDIYPELVERGLVVEMGEGQVGLAGPLLTLMDKLDAQLRQIGLSLPNAREYRYPTLIPSEVLERSGYSQSFPHFLMFVTRLHNDIDVYDKFLEASCCSGGLPENLFEYCSNKDYCLPPTMCYHYFHQMTGRSFGDNQTVVARGKSFRFETKYSRGLARLWDFTIREIVFVGSRSFVIEARENVMAKAFSLMERLGLSGRCIVANDHFFANNETVIRVATQQLMTLKYELRLDTGPDETVAAASFNLHERHFTDAFDINERFGTPSFSGCVGFGLERLTYSFLCQHGLDPSAWPDVPEISGTRETKGPWA